MSDDAKTVPVLKNEDDLNHLLATDPAKPVLIFKHSTTCPVSAAAYREFHNALDVGDLVGVRPAVVRVIEERPLSQAIARRWTIAHQSPQALLVQGPNLLWHASHHAITRAALGAAVKAAATL
jgi:bacillithiol system protein YtxJ